MTPYENSNRIPVTLIDALLVRSVPAPAEDPAGTDGQLQRLVETVAYCMQARQLPGLRATAAEFLHTGLPQQARYFRRRRLAVLDLPTPDLPWGTGEPAAHRGTRRRTLPFRTGRPLPTAQRVPPARAPRLHPRALLRIGRAGRRRLGRLAKLGTRLRPEHRHATGAE